MLAPHYLKWFAGGFMAWLCIFLFVTGVIDPYGISPFALEIRGLNAYKPKRKDIDRTLKPFEVWKKAPRTLFLGTSRIHQAMDPAVLDSTPLAPAYNAAIPASSLQLNVAHLEKYLKLSPEIDTVFAELLIYNFIEEHPVVNRQNPRLAFAEDAAALMLSSDTWWAGLQTVYYNSGVGKPCPEIRSGGDIEYPERRVYSEGNNFYGNFLTYPTAQGIWAFHHLHIRASGRMELQEASFEAVSEMVRLCRRAGVRLVFLVTPTYAQDDYYIDVYGGAELKVRWLERVAGIADVYVFSLPFEQCYEPLRRGMKYWFDPMHFSHEMGGPMLRSLGNVLSGVESRLPLAQLLAPSMARSYIEARERALQEWLAGNQWFTTAFETGRREWEVTHRGRVP